MYGVEVAPAGGTNEDRPMAHGLVRKRTHGPTGLEPREDGPMDSRQGLDVPDIRRRHHDSFPQRETHIPRSLGLPGGESQPHALPQGLPDEELVDINAA